MKEALRVEAPPSLYDQVEVLPLHQKKENRSTDTANHTTQNTLENTQENRVKKEKVHKKSETLKKAEQRI